MLLPNKGLQVMSSDLGAAYKSISLNKMVSVPPAHCIALKMNECAIHAEEGSSRDLLKAGCVKA